MTVDIRPMHADDALEIQRQPSQRIQLGMDREMTREEAEALADGPGEAWCARVDGRIVALTGLRETFPGVQAVAWAILSTGIGAAHLAVTRHARRRIADSAYRRIEAIVRVDVPAEVAWAKLVGLAPAHVLHCFGAASEPHLLCELVRPAPGAATIAGGG
ncbi:hypothetical protein [Sphingomonas ginsenosidimutans]|jgi:hypothetical protein|uniref:hypothetical protein n=1 Tax=Sphingomonas ginsenosidimutans TaxID=862134 RepID=UPI001D9BBAD4|nr:hypothetical protein [Sphingomonas ginsenosidimutans]MBY0301243.1 hypothetical protein [Sphingomonas ginsenosidimutans]